MSDDAPVGNQWFGDPWPDAVLRAPVCDDDRLRIPTPVGEPCMSCGHLIGLYDRGTAMMGITDYNAETGEYRHVKLYQHVECSLRSVLGCYGDLTGHGHSHDRDYRDDAVLVQQWVQEHGLGD